MDHKRVIADIAKHLMEQKVQSTDSPPSSDEDEAAIQCYYRFESNGKCLKCAIGALIPDELYRSSMEYKDICVLLNRFKYPELVSYLEEKYGPISFEDIKFMVACQTFHDNFGIIREFGPDTEKQLTDYVETLCFE